MLNFATSQKVTLVSLIAVAALLFVFIVVIGPPQDLQQNHLMLPMAESFHSSSE